MLRIYLNSNHWQPRDVKPIRDPTARNKPESSVPLPIPWVCNLERNAPDPHSFHQQLVIIAIAKKRSEQGIILLSQGSRTLAKPLLWKYRILVVI